MKNAQIKPFQPDKYKNGINLIGNIKALSGLGQSCRLVANELQESGIDFSIYNYSQLGNVKEDDEKWDDRITLELPYNINVIHINPYEFGIAFAQLPSTVWDYRYNIAFWLWELEEFPDEWVPCISCLNEIWTPSEFISESLRKKTHIPVRTIPYSVNVLMKKEYDRSFFGLPADQFLYLMMYDSYSICERKNPKGAMEAFRKAFDKDNNKVGIIIKINNAVKEDIQLIKEEMEDYQNVYIISETLNKDQVNSLIRCSDVLVSLHRAEGFGLVLAEAMLLGVPTIATNWSSNTEFMNHEVSCMVDYKLIELEQDMGPFKKGNRWADPDIIEASKYMKILYMDQEFYHRLACSAKKHIQSKLSMESAVKLIKERFSEIMEQNG
jgi:Glycosyltransferase